MWKVCVKTWYDDRYACYCVDLQWHVRWLWPILRLSLHEETKHQAVWHPVWPLQDSSYRRPQVWDTHVYFILGSCRELVSLLSPLAPHPQSSTTPTYNFASRRLLFLEPKNMPCIIPQFVSIIDVRTCDYVVLLYFVGVWISSVLLLPHPTSVLRVEVVLNSTNLSLPSWTCRHARTTMSSWIHKIEQNPRYKIKLVHCRIIDNRLKVG